HHDRERQTRELLLRELLAHRPELLIRHPVLSEPCHAVRPGERGAFARRKVRRFAPNRDAVQPLLRLARGARVLRVHVHAVRAVVQVRRPQLHQVQQRVLEPRRADRGLHVPVRLEQVGRDAMIVESARHGHSPSLGRRSSAPFVTALSPCPAPRITPSLRTTPPAQPHPKRRPSPTHASPSSATVRASSPSRTACSARAPTRKTRCRTRISAGTPPTAPLSRIPTTGSSPSSAVCASIACAAPPPSALP